LENGIPIRRDRKTGKKRDLKQEKKDKEEEEEVLRKHKEKYAVWGKGYAYIIASIISY
jgi:hypothetical protein